MWRYHNPVDVHFGAHVLAELPRVVGARKAVLITFPEAADIGVTRRVQALLGPALSGVYQRRSRRDWHSRIPKRRSRTRCRTK